MEYNKKSKNTIILALETLLEQCEDCDINMSIEIEQINKLINTIKREEMITIKYYLMPNEGEVVIDEEGMRIEFENKLEELVRTYK